MEKYTLLIILVGFFGCNRDEYPKSVENFKIEQEYDNARWMFYQSNYKISFYDNSLFYDLYDDNIYNDTISIIECNISKKDTRITFSSDTLEITIFANKSAKKGTITPIKSPYFCTFKFIKGMKDVSFRELCGNMKFINFTEYWVHPSLLPHDYKYKFDKPIFFKEADEFNIYLRKNKELINKNSWLYREAVKRTVF